MGGSSSRDVCFGILGSSEPPKAVVKSTETVNQEAIPLSGCVTHLKKQCACPDDSSVSLVCKTCKSQLCVRCYTSSCSTSPAKAAVPALDKQRLEYLRSADLVLTASVVGSKNVRTDNQLSVRAALAKDGQDLCSQTSPVTLTHLSGSEQKSAWAYPGDKPSFKLTDFVPDDHTFDVRLEIMENNTLKGYFSLFVNLRKLLDDLCDSGATTEIVPVNSPLVIFLYLDYIKENQLELIGPADANSVIPPGAQIKAELKIISHARMASTTVLKIHEKIEELLKPTKSSSRKGARGNRGKSV